jgi:hypothetical protein
MMQQNIMCSFRYGKHSACPVTAAELPLLGRHLLLLLLLHGPC